jgi:hypothetical protein
VRAHKGCRRPLDIRDLRRGQGNAVEAHSGLLTPSPGSSHMGQSRGQIWCVCRAASRRILTLNSRVCC